MRLSPYTFPIKGDISREDAVLLAHHSADRNVVEFGVGGSTMIISAFIGDGVLHSFETDGGWKRRTERNARGYIDKGMIRSENAPRIALIGNDGLDISDCLDAIKQPIDVSFVDAIDEIRLLAMEESWKRLRPGGVVIVHDIRRKHDFDQALLFFHDTREESSGVEYCPMMSNCMVIHKRRGERPAKWHNWNRTQKSNNRVDPTQISEIGRVYG